MPILDNTELIALVKPAMGATSAKVLDESFTSAIRVASQELHWTLPLDDPFKECWMVERTKRHAIQILLIESASKFQYKQIYLQHRFQNYLKLIQLLDGLFEKAIEDYPLLFDVGTYDRFVEYIGNSFQYDIAGREV